MLAMKEIRPNIFELKESIMGVTMTKVTYWYYDLTRNLVSEKPNFPDEMITRSLDKADRMWFERYYRPLLKSDA